MLLHGSAIRPWPSGKIMAATPRTPEAAHIRAGCGATSGRMPAAPRHAGLLHHLPARSASPGEQGSSARSGEAERRARKGRPEADFGMSVRQINPFKLRQFAKASGALAKNDRLDARMIASFVAVMPTRRNPRGGRYV
jgi:hypothetical protein